MMPRKYALYLYQLNFLGVHCGYNFWSPVLPE